MMLFGLFCASLAGFAIGLISANLQAYVHSKQATSAKVIIEKVFTVTTQSYEANDFDEQNNLIKKIKFKQFGR